MRKELRFREAFGLPQMTYNNTPLPVDVRMQRLAYNECSLADCRGSRSLMNNENNQHRPLGILLISIFYLFGAVLLFASMFTNYVGVGQQITLVHGLPLAAEMIVLPAIALLALGISCGLFFLTRWGYFLTLIYQICFGTLSLILLLSDGRQPFIGNFIWSGIVVIYLILNRRSFAHPALENQNQA